MPRSACRVEGAGGDALFAVDGLDEVLGELTGLGRGDGPADHVAGEDVDDDVELEVLAAVRAAELGDVPGPDLVRGGGHAARVSCSPGGSAAGVVRGSRPRPPTGGTWSRCCTGRCRRRGAGPTPGPGPGRSNPATATRPGHVGVRFHSTRSGATAVVRGGPATVAGPAGSASPGTGPTLGMPARSRSLQFGEMVGDHGFDFVSVSALSESNSKSACAFPVISNASLVRASSASSRSMRSGPGPGPAPLSTSSPGGSSVPTPRPRPVDAVTPLGQVRGVQALPGVAERHAPSNAPAGRRTRPGSGPCTQRRTGDA